MLRAWFNTNHKSEAGFSVVEILLALGVFVLLVAGVAGGISYGRESMMLGGQRARAAHVAQESLDAVRSIRDANFASITPGTYGLSNSGGVWVLNGSSDTVDGFFTRQVVIASQAASGSAPTYSVKAVVTWQQNAQRTGTVTATDYFSNWRTAVVPPNKGGMLVYSIGGATNGAANSDTVQYSTINTSGTWSAVGTLADVDVATTNKTPMVVKVYSALNTNNKVAVIRYYNGTTQYIYAQVWNGSTWGSVLLLSSWTAATFADVQNFDGTYLNNGNFVAIFSDNTTTPKSRTWNGSTWGAQASLTTLGAGQTPTYIVAKARPGTNEITAGFFTQASDTITQYYNGTTWSAITSHATDAPVNTRRLIDFTWSPSNPLLGALVYTTANNGNGSRQLTAKIWTANGSGSGAWSGATTTALQGTGANRIDTLAIVGRPTAAGFTACDSDTQLATICYNLSAAGAWSNPTNQTLTSAADSGDQLSYNLGYEQLSGSPAVGVFSDSTSTPKLKKYNAGTTTWDASPTNLPTLLSPLKTVRIVPMPASDNIMILLGDNSSNLASVVWNGTNDAINSPTVGAANVENFSDSNASGLAESFQITATASGTLNKLWAYVDSGSTATNMVLGIYSDAGGSPGALLGQASLASPTAAAWNSVVVNIPVTSGTNYWISILGTGGGAIRFRDRASGGPCTSVTSSSSSLVTLPANWTTGSSFTTCPLSGFGAVNGYSFNQWTVRGAPPANYYYDFAWDNN